MLIGKVISIRQWKLWRAISNSLKIELKNVPLNITEGNGTVRREIAYSYAQTRGT